MISGEAPLYGPHHFDLDSLDSAPEDYRKWLRVLVGKQLQGEIAACELFCRTVQYLDLPAHKVEMVETAKDEADHVAVMEKLARDIGVDMARLLATRRPLARHFLGEDDEIRDWAEVCVFKHLIDRAGRIWLWTMRDSSFRPHSEALRPILRDEARHGNEGANEIVALCEAGRRAEVQRHVDRWFPRAIRLLGRPQSEGNRITHRYGLKSEDSAAEMRKYAREIRPALDRAGIRIPTPAQVREQGIEIHEAVW